jgi:hypothetical protein
VQLRHLISKAWRLVHGFKGTFWLATLYAVGVMLLVTLITSPFHFLGQAAGIAYPTDFLMSIIISYFTLPAGLGIYLLALHRGLGQPIKASQIFSYYRLPIMGQVFLLTLLFIIIMGLLFTIPAWWLRVILIFVLAFAMTVWIFSTMLIAEESISFAAATIKAGKAVFKHVIKIIVLYLFFGVLLLIGAITLGIGYIWIAPFIINVFALLYQDLFHEKGL